MRVRKNIFGKYIVEDEPIRLKGEEAREFVAAMSARDVRGNTEEQTRFLNECEQIYRNAKRPA